VSGDAHDLGIADKVVALHRELRSAELPHAFGGALALAWCTQRARGTVDIDLNVFVSEERAAEVFDVLPAGVYWTEDDVARCRRDGQVRVWWGRTPIDLFTSTTEFHAAVADRHVTHDFAGESVPFLSCTDLAVFKAFFDRSRDWADIDEMLLAGTLDGDRVIGVLVRYLDPDDARVTRLRALLADRVDRNENTF
jgi:hypothetical protein